MKNQTESLEHASVRQYCKAVRVSTIGANFVPLAEQAVKENHKLALLSFGGLYYALPPELRVGPDWLVLGLGPIEVVRWRPLRADSPNSAFSLGS
jgi:hypothetical protein